MDISVIIPVYNEEENIYLLHERLSSIMQQLKVQYELIFVNDGSVDQSLALVKGLAQQDSAVKYIDLVSDFLSNAQ